MNVDKEVEVDRILVQADILIPDSSPELLGAVGLPQYIRYMRRGDGTPRGEQRPVWIGGDPLQGSPLRLLRGYGCGCKMLPHLMLQY